MIYPVGKDGKDELPRLEGIDDPLDQAIVRLHGHVTLKADVGKFRLWSDVDGHILALHSNRTFKKILFQLVFML